MLDVLLAYQADAKVQNEQGHTALQRAYQHNNPAAIQTLLRYTATTTTNYNKNESEQCADHQTVSSVKTLSPSHHSLQQRSYSSSPSSTRKQQLSPQQQCSTSSPSSKQQKCDNSSKDSSTHSNTHSSRQSHNNLLDNLDNEDSSNDKMYELVEVEQQLESTRMQLQRAEEKAAFWEKEWKTIRTGSAFTVAEESAGAHHHHHAAQGGCCIVQ